MIVRDATREDIPAILAIYNQAVLRSTATADYEPRTLAQRQEWFEQRTRQGLPVLVAELEGGEIGGWAALSPYHDRIGYRFTVENSIYIAEQNQGRGLGKALLGELVARAEPLDVHAIVASISGDNEASIRLHARFGFTHCGHLPELVWKFDQWIDVIYMVKLLKYAPAPGG